MDFSIHHHVAYLNLYFFLVIHSNFLSVCLVARERCFILSINKNSFSVHIPLAFFPLCIAVTNLSINNHSIERMGKNVQQPLVGLLSNQRIRLSYLPLCTRKKPSLGWIRNSLGGERFRVNFLAYGCAKWKCCHDRERNWSTAKQLHWLFGKLPTNRPQPYALFLFLRERDCEQPRLSDDNRRR